MLTSWALKRSIISASLGALLAGFSHSVMAVSSTQESAVQALLERINNASQAGRVYHRDKLIEQLFRVAPGHPASLNLRLIEALENNNPLHAQELLQQLEDRYPQHPLTAVSRQRVYLNKPNVNAQLVNARLAMLAGKRDEAWNKYQQVFDQAPLVEPYRSDWLALQPVPPTDNDEPFSAVAQIAENPANPVEETVSLTTVANSSQSEAETSVPDADTVTLVDSGFSTNQPVPVESDPLADFTLEQTPTLTVGYQAADRRSTDGLTSLRSRTLLVNLTVPTEDGRWWLTTDAVNADAGAFDLTNDFQRDRYGTGILCQQPECSQGLLPNEGRNGVAFGVGYENTRWNLDIGISPVGFDRSELLGGIEYSGDWGTVGWSLGIERRIETTALLNFSGIDDPFSPQREWGPVTRTGIGASFSWDQGELFGWWSNLGVERYAGHNVDSNQRWYAYTGSYWRLVDTEPFAFTAGITALSWGFDKNRGETTYGHGAYYSPQHYVSISFPLQIYGRLDRFSYQLRASFGLSNSRIDSAPFFPTDPKLQALAGQPSYSASANGGGFGKSYQGALEYRVTDHWVIGAAAQLDRAEFYTPNNYSLYLRYDFGGSNIALRPPRPPSRYVDR